MSKKNKLVIISDTHTMHRGLENKFYLPPADFIIHCGDISSVGTENSIIQFLDWYSNLNQYEHKIFVAGNHDWLFESSPGLAKEILKKYPNVHYLEDSGIKLNGINFYGSPVSKIFNNWAFNRPEETLQKHWEAIPKNTDVLITHELPYTILDYVSNRFNSGAVGSPSLYVAVLDNVKPKIHCFGHVHGGYGTKTIENTTFINASTLNEQYKINNPPIVIEI